MWSAPRAQRRRSRWRSPPWWSTRPEPCSRLRAWRAAYEKLASSDFCGDVLGKVRGLSALVLPRAMGWSDLGTPERMESWLQRDLVQPSFG